MGQESRRKWGVTPEAIPKTCHTGRGVEWSVASRSPLRLLLRTDESGSLFGFALRRGRVAPSYLRTTNTGQWACVTTDSETLPIKALFRAPRPLLPITIAPAPSSSLGFTISLSGSPALR